MMTTHSNGVENIVHEAPDHSFARLLPAVLTVLALGAGWLGGPARAETTLTMAHAVDKTDVIDTVVAAFNELLAQSSGGDVALSPLVSGDADGYPYSSVNSVLSGDVHLALVPIRIAAELDPDFAVFDVPFLLDDLAAADRLTASEPAAAMLDGLRAFGLIGLGFLHQGMRDLVGKDLGAEPNSLQGTKLAVAGPVAFRPFAGFGASTTELPSGDIGAAISQDAVDAAEATLLEVEADRDLKGQERLVVSDHSYEGWVLLANRDWFETLSPDTQTGLRAALQATLEQINGGAAARTDAVLGSLAGTIGEVITLDYDAKQRWREAMAESLRAYEAAIDPAVMAAARSANIVALGPDDAGPEGPVAFTFETTRDLTPGQYRLPPWMQTAAIDAGRNADYTPVQLFYGTDRRNDSTETGPRFGGERGGKLQLGKVIVTVPKTHRLGVIERPAWYLSWTGILGREDPKRHIVMNDPVLQRQDDFIADLRVLVSDSEKRQALVFVHGFNVSFEEAAWRTAQIAYDLQFDGAPMFYSWPSRGAVEDYPYDQNSARQAEDTLEEFLELVKAESGAEIVHLIGHSMGTNPLMEVVADMWKAEGVDPMAPLFSQIILAAADIDRDVFFDLARQVKGAAEGFTLYASARDVALKFSRNIAGGIPRIGDVPATGPVVYPDLDTIDATALATEFFSLKHSEYADNRTLLDDIGLLLSQGLRPPNARTPSMRAISTADGVYWQYPR